MTVSRGFKETDKLTASKISQPQEPQISSNVHLVGKIPEKLTQGTLNFPIQVSILPLPSTSPLCWIFWSGRNENRLTMRQRHPRKPSIYHVNLDTAERVGMKSCWCRKKARRQWDKRSATADFLRSSKIEGGLPPLCMWEHPGGRTSWFPGSIKQTLTTSTAILIEHPYSQGMSHGIAHKRDTALPNQHDSSSRMCNIHID